MWEELIYDGSVLFGSTKKPPLCLQLDHIDTVIKEDDSDYDEFVCIEDDAADDSLEIS